MREGTANPKSTRQTTGSDAGPLRSSGENNGGQAALPDSAGRLPACQDSLAGYHPSKAGNLDLREMTMRLVGGENLSRTEAADCLNEHGICFIFAPLFHLAAARVAHVRRDLGVHTTFNLLGPLTNPARAPFQLLGVWHPSLVERIASALSLLDVEKAWVVHGSDGLDEVTITGETFVASCSACTGVETFTISPEDFGIQPRSVSQRRESPAENARMTRAILDGETNGDFAVVHDLV